MKVMIKIMVVLIILMAIMSILPLQTAHAESIIGEAKTWFEEAKANGSQLISPGEVTTQLKPIYKILFWAGVITIFIAFPVLGIQYMIANPEKKGELKTKLIGLVLAAVVILGAYTIWEITYLFMNEIIN